MWFLNPFNYVHFVETYALALVILLVHTLDLKSITSGAAQLIFFRNNWFLLLISNTKPKGSLSSRNLFITYFVTMILLSTLHNSLKFILQNRFLTLHIELCHSALFQSQSLLNYKNTWANRFSSSSHAHLNYLHPSDECRL